MFYYMNKLENDIQTNRNIPGFNPHGYQEPGLLEEIFGFKLFGGGNLKNINSNKLNNGIKSDIEKYIKKISQNLKKSPLVKYDIDRSITPELKKDINKILTNQYMIELKSIENKLLQFGDSIMQDLSRLLQNQSMSYQAPNIISTPQSMRPMRQMLSAYGGYRKTFKNKSSKRKQSRKSLYGVRRISRKANINKISKRAKKLMI